MSDPVVIFRTSSDVEASIVRGLLEAHGIQAFLTADTPRSLFPVSVNGLSEVRVAVHADDADDARQVIEDYRAADLSGPRLVAIDDAMAPLERALGYRFRDRGLLEHALTHRSHAQEDVSGGVLDNESLEFLGDSILGFIVADVLFREFPAFNEGQKSKIKAALVSAPSLARLATRLGLGEHLLLGRGEEKTGGRQKMALLSDTMEAVIAAIYLDGGLEPVRAFLGRELGALVDMARQPALLTALTGDYKSALQEALQERNEPPPEYRLAAETGPAHRRHFEVDVWTGERRLAGAAGRSKKEAEQAAARLALQALGLDVDREG